MTVVNPKSVSGINSITTGSGSDNLLTIHTSDANNTERVRVNSSGDVIVGSGITVSPDGNIFATGIITATSYSGIDLSAVTGATGDFSIADKIVHTGDTNTAIRFPDADTITTETGGSERTRVDSGGRVIIGGTTPLDSTAGALTVDCGTSGGRIALRGTTTNASSGIGEVFAHWDTNKVAGFQMRSGTDTSNKDDGTIEFYTANGSGVVEQLAIAAAGDVTVKTGNLVIGTSGKGIDFSATSDSAGSMTSELFSDYEEGTFTLTENGGISITVYVAEYIRIGRMVHIEVGLAVASNSDGGVIQFSGLPFAVKDTADNTGGLHLVSTNSGRNDLIFAIRGTDDVAVTTNQNLNASRSNYSNKQLKFSGSYTAA